MNTPRHPKAVTDLSNLIRDHLGVTVRDHGTYTTAAEDVFDQNAVPQEDWNSVYDAAVKEAVKDMSPLPPEAVTDLITIDRETAKALLASADYALGQLDLDIESAAADAEWLADVLAERTRIAAAADLVEAKLKEQS